MARFGTHLFLPHPMTSFTLTYKSKRGCNLDSETIGIRKQPSEGRRRCFPPLLKMMLFLISFMGPTWLRAETISGTIKDPSGAVITGARIEITGGDLTQPLVVSSDGLGEFVSADLKPGMYSVKVIKDG